MADEAFLLEMSEDAFEELVVDAFKNLKRDPLALARSKLADSSLVIDCLLTGELLNLELRKHGMRALLRWVIDKTRPYPNEQPDLGSLLWRPYCVLLHHYWEGKRISDLYKILGLEESGRDKAIRMAKDKAIKILRDELYAPSHLRERKKCFFQERYTTMHHPDEQQILRLLAVFTCALPDQSLKDLVKEHIGMVLDIDELVVKGLVVQEQTTREVKVHPEVVTTLINLIDADEQRQWHEIAAKYFLKTHDYLTATAHWRMAGADKLDTAAEMLIDNYRAIVEDGEIQAFYKLQEKFHKRDLDKLTWTRLKIATGRAALLVDDIEIARDEFSQAQSAKDRYDKAQAFYLYAKASEKISFGTAFDSYQLALEQLEPLINDTDKRFRNLLVQIYVDKAWLYIQESQDLAQASATLAIAQDLIIAGDSESSCRLYTAWAGLSGKRRDFEGELAYLQKAWGKASEAQDDELMILTAHNLGQFYVLRRKQFATGLDYLNQARSRAHDIHHREWESKCEQAIGAAYYFLEQFDEAITHYKLAYTTYKRIGNQNWLAWVCWDLAEVYATKKDYGPARHYYGEADELAAKVAAQDLFAALKNLARRFSQLTAKLTDGQMRALEFVDSHGKITNREYQDLTAVLAGKALRELRELVDLGILIPDGQGRAAGYCRKPDAEDP